MPIELTVNSKQVALVDRSLAKADHELQVRGKTELEAIGRIVARDAQNLALMKIPHMFRSVQWSKMRVGQNRELVYVVPRKRRTKVPRRKRPNLAPLMLKRAMRPAKTTNEEVIFRRFEKLTNEIAREFNR